MLIRPTNEYDWAALKAVRLAALRDAPTAFGVTHAAAAAHTDDQWRRRASGATLPAFWLAWHGEASEDKTAMEPVGLAGGGIDARGRYNLIAMWVAPPFRGLGVARPLVDAVKAHARACGHARVVLDVAPGNLRAAAFYRRQGFAFIDECEPLASHPHIRVQTMEWLALPGSD
jgi:ribosomal protein S18 acetylase RimI-like enzyme